MKIWHIGATEDGALAWLCLPDFFIKFLILIFLYYDRERVVKGGRLLTIDIRHMYMSPLSIA